MSSRFRRMAKTGTPEHQSLEKARGGDAAGLLDAQALLGPGLRLRRNRDDRSRLSAALTITRLKKRSEFLACAQAPSCAKGAVVMQARPRGDDDPAVRVGFTATKRIGGAVERNRAKRRMREAARLILPQHAEPGCDYVLIARGGVIKRPWERLLDDVKSALIRLAAERSAPQIKAQS